jgi:hypothetical protein
MPCASISDAGVSKTTAHKLVNVGVIPVIQFTDRVRRVPVAALRNLANEAQVIGVPFGKADAEGLDRIIAESGLGEADHEIEVGA